MPLWTNRYNGPGNYQDFANAVAVDGSGNVFVTASSATIAYSSAGLSLWTNRYPGSSTSGATGLAMDGSGPGFLLCAAPRYPVGSNYWSLAGRIHYSIVTVAGLASLGGLYYWYRLGVQYK